MVPEAMDDAVELTNPMAIRAIAHPARLVVIEALYDQGRELTATQAAALASTTPSAMSYHLRALERFGIVRRGSSTGDARERPWVRAAKDLRIRPPATSSRAVKLAASAVISTAMGVTRDRLLTAMERVANPEAPRGPLDDAIHYQMNSLLVTSEEARALMQSISEVLAPLQYEERTDAPDGAARLTLVIASIPDADSPGDDAPDTTRS